MQVHDLIQGSPAWHAYRAEHDNASDAPAMMGVSSYKSRDALIAERASGVTPEVDAATQRLYDSGHRFEALARPLAEAIIEDDLYPVTGSNGRLSASFDGLTMDRLTAYEHKRLNKRLRQAFADIDALGPDAPEGDAGRTLPMEYQVQMEQQCAVSGCMKVLFMASDWADDGTLLEELHCWYHPNAGLRAQIAAGWAQLHQDVTAYQVPAAAVTVVAEPVTALPAVFARVSGSIALKDNLPEFELALREFIAHDLVTKPETDQDFATLDSQIKALKGAEAALDASEEQALSQAEMLSAFKRQKDMLHKLTRDTRLAAEKLLTAEKERIKLEQVQRGQKELAAHVAALNATMPAPYMPTVQADFAGAIKGKRTVDTLRSAVNDELARAKVAAGDIATRIHANLKTLEASGLMVHDTAALVVKAPDDLVAVIAARRAAEQARQDAERERIRREEQERADREARAKLLADEAKAQEAIADAAQQNQIAAPIAADLSALASSRRAEAVSHIDAGLAISAAQRAATEAEPATLNLGTINQRLQCFSVTAAGLTQLGIEPAGRDKRSMLYTEHQFVQICDAIARRVAEVKSAALQPA